MAQGKTDNLEAFAKRIETRIRKARGSDDGMEQLICRLLTGNDANIATKLAEKWVEWRYGKAKQAVELSAPGGGPLEHTISFENPIER
jgi:hypothetical protein